MLVNKYKSMKKDLSMFTWFDFYSTKIALRYFTHVMIKVIVSRPVTVHPSIISGIFWFQKESKAGVMEAWVTLATNDNYAVGALTLAQSLKRVQTTKNVVVMITQEVSENMKKVLEEVFDKVFVVDPLDSGDLANLTLLDRTELGITFTKVID